MDARERLRRYLEQRRELGESELVLDGMPVEEVLRIVGAKKGKGGASAGAQGGTSAGGDPREERGGQDRRAPDGRRVEDRVPELRDRPAEGEPASGNWRETLRAAGTAPEGEGTRRPPSRPRDTDIPRGADESPPERASRPPVEKEPMRERAEPKPAPDGDGKSLLGLPVGITVAGQSAELFGGPIGTAGSLEEIAGMVQKCTRCPLYKTATHGVPGEGHPNADLMVVGEAPGENEDKSGRPFIGQAGQLLTKILAAIKLEREDVFIANVLKHRPPGNRNPAPDEIEACSPYLLRQIELVKPKVILALGTFAAQTLLQTKTPMGKLRGSLHRYHGVPLIVTYHPAALLRNPSWKKPTWEDVQLVRRLLDHADA